MLRLSVPIYKLKRRAKLRARDEKIPLHEAQDRIAREEGFEAWSALSSRMAANSPASALLSRLADGDMFLLGARPGHGKTLLGLQLLLDAAHEGRRTVFFTLEYTDQEVMERIRSLGEKGLKNAPEIVTSGEISADFIVRHLRVCLENDWAGFHWGWNYDSSSGCGRNRAEAGWPLLPRRRSAIRRI